MRNSYWVELDDFGNPTGHICHAYYDGDKPVDGYWVKVEETGETNE